MKKDTDKHMQIVQEKLLPSHRMCIPTSYILPRRMCGISHTDSIMAVPGAAATVCL